MKTFEELKQEAVARGIKPGAKIACAYGQGNGIVQPYDTWTQRPSSLWCGSDNNGASLRAWSDGRWATVITPAPEDQPEGLVDGMACKCDLEMRRAIVRKAKELGLVVSGLPESHADIHGIRVGPGASIVTNAREHGLNWITPGEFYDRLCRTVKPEPPIRIGGHDVNFRKGEIMVGCTTVTNDIVRKVAERLKD